MAFPQTLLNIKGEMLINNVWTDITSYIRADAGITINRGKANEQNQIQASTCTFTLNNRDGRFSNRNPNSPYYGKLPRNTQVRISAGDSDIYLKGIGGVSGSRTWIADKASLDITGNIDIRVDIAPTSWADTYAHTLASKWLTTGSQRSWGFFLTSAGRLIFNWSPDGSTIISTGSTVAVNTSVARQALRVVLTANNGSGGNTVTFYTAPAGNLNGTWTQLGSTVVNAGTTSIFNSTATVEVGSINIGNPKGMYSNGRNFDGKFYAIQIRNSASTVVLEQNFSNAAYIGSILFSDAYGNDYNIFRMRVTSSAYRFVGELSELPAKWDKTGKDVYIPITASGLIRRLSQGATPLHSPIYRNVIQYPLIGYWALEDDAGAITAGSALPNGVAATFSNMTFNQDKFLPSSKGVIELTGSNSSFYATIPSGDNNATTMFYMVYFKMPTNPATSSTLVDLYTNGTVATWNISVTNASYRVAGYAADRSLISETITEALWGAGGEPNQWVALRLLVTQSAGNNLSIEIAWRAVTNNTPYGTTVITTAGGYKVGRITGFRFLGTGGNDGTRFAHTVAAQQNLPFANADFYKAGIGYAGEAAAARITRICAEESIPVIVEGVDPSELMGPQPIDTVLNIIYDAIAVDDGILYEPRDFVGLGYTSRLSLNEMPVFDLNYAANTLSAVPEPTEDDQNLVNDATVSRPNGSNARYTKDSGPLSIQASPNGVGRYDNAVSLNAYTDDRLVYLAEYIVYKGTIDEARYPRTEVNLARTPFVTNATLTEAIRLAELGNNFRITNLPKFLPPGPVNQLIQGINEYINKFEWSFTFNSSPYIYRFNNGVVATATRADSADGKLTSAITSTQTSFSVTSTTPWIDSTGYASMFPFSIKVGGEEMTVTAITGTSSPQTFTVTRSVNGIVKAQTINTPVNVTDVFIASL